MTPCTCFIIPRDVLDRLAHDDQLATNLRRAAADSSRITDILRAMRIRAGDLSIFTRVTSAHLVNLATSPDVAVYDCKHTQTLPGSRISASRSSADVSAKTAFLQTTDVVKFYQDVFGRNSIDNKGMTLLSTVHFGDSYNNAMWNGSQMIYGDGDGQIFIDFTQSNDVIGHELTHGVTQYSLQLDYSGDAGGLNESISDCFGSMFRQWQAGETAADADWLIGSGIIGPDARAQGYNCLRNMADPADKAALAPQPVRYSDITPGMDPHYSSGPPNLAFATACMELGGNSWSMIGQVWYAAVTASGPRPQMNMPDFAARTRQLAAQNYATNQAVVNAVDIGWKKVGL